MYDEKAKKIFEIMISNGDIPQAGSFEITQALIEKSYEIGNKLFLKIGKRRTPSEMRFNKKIAGLNFFHLLEERKEKILEEVNKKYKQNSGYLYVISNYSFPDHIKIGITQNIHKRLIAYQTCDPYRRYKIEKYVFVENNRMHEKYLKTKMNIDVDTGEWVSVNKKKEIFEYMNGL